MNLLIVEDEKVQVQLYTDAIESFNKKSEIKISPTPIYDLKNALEALASSDYDAAIIDLKLSQNATKLEGLEIVDSILKKLRFPVFILSGSIGQVEMAENALFKKRSRDSDFKKVLHEIVEIYGTGITKILGKKGEIDKYLHEIFWKHLATSLDVWTKDEKRNHVEKHKSLLRYILLHVQEYLELSEDSTFELFHPAEIYIKPPIKASVFTGDIVLENDTSKSYIVLTPSCDLAQGKAKNILLATIENETTGILFEKINIIKKNKATEKTLNEAEHILKKLFSNSYSNKYHYLPSYDDINGGLINFQKLTSVKPKGLEKSFTVIASTSNTFTKDIIARFSHYYSRQGSPDFNIDEIYDSLF